MILGAILVKNGNRTPYANIVMSLLRD